MEAPIMNWKLIIGLTAGAIIMFLGYNHAQTTATAKTTMKDRAKTSGNFSNGKFKN